MAVARRLSATIMDWTRPAGVRSGMWVCSNEVDKEVFNKVGRWSLAGRFSGLERAMKSLRTCPLAWSGEVLGKL